MQLSDPAAKLGRLWNTACALVEVEWNGIVGAARNLRAEVEMSDSAFADAWRAVRPRSAVRLRRLARLGSLEISEACPLRVSGRHAVRQDG
jgi:hypothetical protein